MEEKTLLKKKSVHMEEKTLFKKKNLFIWRRKLIIIIRNCCIEIARVWSPEGVEKKSLS